MPPANGTRGCLLLSVSPPTLPQRTRKNGAPFVICNLEWRLEWVGHPPRLEAEAKAAQEWADKRAEMSLHPLNPRTDVSADAIHIAKHTSGRIVGHLWCIFVLLPVVLGILFAMLK
jgi:hypothetical protein